MTHPHSVVVPVVPTEAMLDAFSGTRFRTLPPAKQEAERKAYAVMLTAAPVHEEGGAVNINAFRRAFWGLAFDVIPARDNPGDGKWRLGSAAVRILADAAVNTLDNRSDDKPCRAVDDLVDRFAAALKEKLHAAEAKYGHGDAWKRDDWRDDLVHALCDHVAKGDPRDVAAYCAFAWHHGWSLAAQPQAREEAHPVAWRTIDSAPKDGTVIDAWRNEGGRDTVFWGYPHHESGEMGSLCDSDWHSIRAPGWVCNTFNELLGRAHNPFTHWKPLDGGPDTIRPAPEAEKLREAMPDLSSVIAWLDNGCDPKHAVTELTIYKARIDQALSAAPEGAGE